MTKRFAGFMAIFAFFVVCVSGLFADTDMADVLLRALAAMAVFFFLGLLVGHVANRILLDSLFGEDAPDIEKVPKEEVKPEGRGAEAPPS
jgi:hypothetical protein